MTPRPTEASFDLRTEVGRAPGEFSAVVSGLDPNEAFTFVVGMPGRPGTPMRESADERGRFEIHFDQPAPGGTCLLAKRSGGQIARSEVGVPAGGACAADVVYLYLSGPATLRASEFTDFTSVAPAGEVVEFIGLVGPDGPLVPDWTSERLGPPPEGILFQLSPSYDRQGPLPPGPYIISYRLMGQEYHFTLTITR